MNRRSLALRGLLAMLGAGLLATPLGIGCKDDASSRPYVSYTSVDTEANADTVFPPPFTAEETSALRSGFSWASTSALPTADAQGRPSLYYALVLVGDAEQRDLLDVARVYYSALPLFDAELARWDELGPGAVDIVGDDHGTFVFAVLTGDVYNAIREAALAGEPSFEAVLLRSAPDASVMHADGSLDFDALVDGGCTFGFTEAELADAKLVPGRAVAPLFGRLVRLVHRIVTFVRNVVPFVAARVRPQRDFSLRMRVINVRDPFFDGTIPPGTPAYDRNVLRSAWRGDASPIVPRGATIEIRSPLALSFGTIGSLGQATARVPHSASLRVVLRLGNGAATITSGGLFERHVFIKDMGDDGAPSRSSDVHLALDVRDHGLHALSVLTDAYDFVRERFEWTPRKAIVVDGFRESFRASSTPCWTFFTPGTIAFGAGRGWSLAGIALHDGFLDYDVNLRGNAPNSRGVPVHEYGHFVTCDMLYGTDHQDFGRAYGELIREVIGDGTGAISPSSQARIAAEAWADFVAAEVVGGTNYFHAEGSQVRSDSIGYCRIGALTSVAPCTEDNWGGPPGMFPNWVGRTLDSDAQRIGLVTTLMVDAFDRPILDPKVANAGIVWDLTHGSMPSMVPTLSDELVSLEPRQLSEVVRDWSAQANRLSPHTLFDAIATTSLRSYDEATVCQMMALHDPSGDCGALASVLGTSLSTGTPLFQTNVLTALNADATSPIITAGWTALDPATTSVGIRLLDSSDHELAAGHVTTTSMGTWTSTSPLPFDASVRVRFLSTSVGTAGPEVERNVRTPAEPVHSVTATPSFASAYVSWTPTIATAYRVVATAVFSGTVTTAETSATFASLSFENFEPRIVQVFSINAVNVVSTVGSPEIDVTPAND